MERETVGRYRETHDSELGLKIARAYIRAQPKGTWSKIMGPVGAGDLFLQVGIGFYPLHRLPESVLTTVEEAS